MIASTFLNLNVSLISSLHSLASSLDYLVVFFHFSESLAHLTNLAHEPNSVLLHASENFKTAIKTPHGKVLQGILLHRETTETITHLNYLPTPNSWLKLQLHYVSMIQPALLLGAKSEVQNELQNIKSKANLKRKQASFGFQTNITYQRHSSNRGDQEKPRESC